MLIAVQIVFWLSIFLIVWAMIGYPISIKLIGKLSKKKNKHDFSLEPSVTVIVVAHNEEKVILEKLENISKLNYPKEKISYIVTSDFSTDSTNELVEAYIQNHPEINLVLHKTKEHKGKTNAQNEAQKIARGEFLVMTDANAMIDANAVKNLMACFTDENIAYVCGCLHYTNTKESDTASSEGAYWSMDVSIREIEGRIASITAGNGAIYACRNKDYFDANPIECHDSIMPFHFALEGKRSINCLDAKAYEKAGEKNQDEYKRKVRMFRGILNIPSNMMKIANPFKYGWFTYFYFGHRACRYSLWWAHLLVLLTNVFLTMASTAYAILLGLQVLFYLIALIQHFIKINANIPRWIHYYVMTVVAQWHAVFRAIAGQTKATWEQAESTR